MLHLPGSVRSDLEEWDRIGIDDPKQSGSISKAPDTGKPVATLLGDYRTRRSAWLAEVEHLAQLRDEVRSAAERETLEILTRARQEARNLIASARRELLVLSEQVHAALGDSESLRTAELPPDPTRQIVFAETSTPRLSTSVVLETHPRRETAKRDDYLSDLDSLVNETESKS